LVSDINRCLAANEHSDKSEETLFAFTHFNLRVFNSDHYGAMFVIRITGRKRYRDQIEHRKSAEPLDDEYD